MQGGKILLMMSMLGCSIVVFYGGVFGTNTLPGNVGGSYRGDES